MNKFIAPALVPDVRIYRAAPPGSVDVAQLEAASGIGFGTPGQERAVIDRLRAEAAALGANGLIIVGVGQARSMRITSAPMSESNIAQNGAGPIPAISMIFRPCSGPMVVW